MTEYRDMIQTGNAYDNEATRGWFVGSFLDESRGLRRRDDIELKWAIHPAGEKRSGWVTGEIRTTIAILISGKWEMEFRGRTIILQKQGDYVMWGRGTDHKWRTLEDTTLLTIRWPSAKQQ